ncbi:hypothetical protein HPB51_006722 [Rhipicephalus microplus]|uniref:Uncharacterized protein n=1 Tax=Rhipicephalus microplus TaxID=6941 RepID=A0A9J6E7N6_RHIMP|nr:hypothetical protein HPB51_006722 [Rhipicephalus microplus]
MSKRKWNDDASTSIKNVEREAPNLIDMNGIQSRHTGLSVDYKKACTKCDSLQCHIWNNRATWNGFFVNVGLVLQESDRGDMSLSAGSEYFTKVCHATHEEKKQAATLMYWLLTQHGCVKALTISEDVFEGNEGVVCRALSGSVGVTTVTLWLSSALINEHLVSSLNLMKHLVRVSVVIDSQESFFSKLARLIRKSPSATDVLGTVLASEQHSPAFVSCFEDLCLKSSLRGVSISTHTDPGPSNLRSHFGRTFFGWHPMQLLTTLQVASPERGPEVDVRGICEAVSASSILIQLNIELLTLREEYAVPIQRMLCSTKTLKVFGLNYNSAEMHYRASFQQRYVDSVIRLYSCMRCCTNHMLETPRVMPWIQALLQVDSSVSELHFSMFAFCTLECRAFLNALSKNASLSMVRIPRLGQLPSEYGKFVANAGVMHRVTANLDLNVAYPAMVQPPQHMPGQSVNVFFVVLGRTLSEAAKFGLVAHVHLKVRSVLCLTGETNPTTSPLVQLIRNAPALETVYIRIENSCCSQCWNLLAPPLCDALLQNRGIQTLAIELPMNPAMKLLPLAGLLHRNPALFKFTLHASCPTALGEFFREVSQPKLWDNYNLAVVGFKSDAPDLVGMMLRIKQVADRNSTLAMRAARFVQGVHNVDNARALETMNGSSLFVKRVCGLLRVDKAQALGKILTCLKDVADMNKFLRLAGIVRRDLVCGESDDGSTQLADLNEDCLRYLRRYLKFSDIQEPV